VQLEVFISELLYDHDCVVLPDFGGVVANYRSARLNRRSHVISPPSKHVGFNRNLKNNDGLLINHVANVLGISYQDAQKMVKECISAFENKLNTEGRLVLHRIGVFFRDRGGQLQFIPDEQENYLLSSFGLTPVQLKFIEQEKEITAEPDTPVVELVTTKRRYRGLKIAAALAIPLAVGGLLLLGKNSQGNGRLNFASLNPFQKYEVVADYSQAVNLPDDAVMSDIQNPVEAWLSGAESKMKFDFVTCQPSEQGIVIRREKVVAEPVSTRVDRESQPLRNETARSSGAGRYAVIGGAFSVAENAENFLQKLRSEGFDAQIAGKKDGLTLVAYGYYNTREEAKQALKNIRSGGGSAWIRRN
jgi:cell division septation protein DedD